MNIFRKQWQVTLCLFFYMSLSIPVLSMNRTPDYNMELSNSIILYGLIPNHKLVGEINSDMMKNCTRFYKLCVKSNGEWNNQLCLFKDELMSVTVGEVVKCLEDHYYEDSQLGSTFLSSFDVDDSMMFVFSQICSDDKEISEIVEQVFMIFRFFEIKNDVIHEKTKALLTTQLTIKEMYVNHSDIYPNGNVVEDNVVEFIFTSILLKLFYTFIDNNLFIDKESSVSFVDCGIDISATLFRNFLFNSARIVNLGSLLLMNIAFYLNISEIGALNFGDSTYNDTNLFIDSDGCYLSECRGGLGFDHENPSTCFNVEAYKHSLHTDSDVCHFRVSNKGAILNKKNSHSNFLDSTLANYKVQLVEKDSIPVGDSFICVNNSSYYAMVGALCAGCAGLLSFSAYTVYKWQLDRRNARDAAGRVGILMI